MREGREGRGGGEREDRKEDRQTDRQTDTDRHTGKGRETHREGEDQTGKMMRQDAE